MKIYFKEEQKYRQPWLWLIIVPIVAATILFFAYGIDKQLIHGEAFGDKPMSDAGLIITAVFSLLLTLGIAVLFYNFRMILHIDEGGIHMRYPPLIRKEKFFKPEEIKRYEVRTYKPIKEYGGWGVKTGSKKNGIAYNVKGNIGLQLYLTNGKKVLFGTQRKEAISLAMKKLMST